MPVQLRQRYEPISQRLHALEAFERGRNAEDLLPGQVWEWDIPHAANASEVILIVLSRTSVATRGYVEHEMPRA
jgi:hypothetical protein